MSLCAQMNRYDTCIQCGSAVLVNMPCQTCYGQRTPAPPDWRKNHPIDNALPVDFPITIPAGFPAETAEAQLLIKALAELKKSDVFLRESGVTVNSLADIIEKIEQHLNHRSGWPISI